MLQTKLEQIVKRRATADPLPATVAPFTSSNFFKSSQSKDKPKSKDCQDRLSHEAKRLTASPLKAASRDYQHQDMVSLGTARPSPEYFPWGSLAMSCPESTSAGANMTTASRLTMQSIRDEADYDLAIALNYGYTAGSPQILRFFTEHVDMIHDPLYSDWETCVTCGTTSALEVALRILCNPEETVLIEGRTYPGILACARALGLHLQGIKLDHGGLVPEDLDRILTTWDLSKGPKPHVLYMIPTGQNPTGTTQPLKRRKLIYQLAEKHDLYILEDDPYYFISCRDITSGSSSSDTPDLDQYLNALPKSYLSLDVSGRVIRMNLTSKILAPGLRAGWITANSMIIDKFISFPEVSALHPSGPTQVMLYKLLDKTWGHDGFLRWLVNLSAQYRLRRDILLSACRDYLPSGICTWSNPELGMFLWIHVKLPHISASAGTFVDGKTPCTEYLDVEEAIFNQARKNGVLVSRGSWFIHDKTELDQVNFRLTFAAAQQDSLKRAVERFGSAVQLCVDHNSL
ncbi:aromatic aminotransferase [Fusarium sporotrichioides]|uniref:Aromatic aminotransferase n=1 Tax=Fusarium sporotrichioides TaxID=5514 RepID=A0A395REY8_FUSSP|nr:aromatic aminotransferase [Fusarium sporotrichioides]